MIQRIQSVYLLIITLLLAFSSFLTVGYFSADNGLTKAIFKPLAITSGENVFSTWALLILLVVGSLLAFLTIFLFKNRPLQIRLSIFNALLMVGYYGALVFFIFKTKSALSADFYADWKICLPLIAFILNYLAIRAIGKDEVLVKSYDRIR